MKYSLRVFIITLLITVGFGHCAKLGIDHVANKRQMLLTELQEDRYIMEREERDMEYMIKHNYSAEQIGQEMQILNSKRFIFFMDKEDLNSFDEDVEGKILIVYRRYF